MAFQLPTASFGASVFAMLLLALGALFLAIAAAITRRCWRHRGWPKAEGRIDKTVLQTNKIPSETCYVVEVEYSFEVGSERHVGTEMVVFYSEQLVQEFLRPYQEGAEVAVSYNPARPADSVLPHELKWDGAFSTAIGLGFALAGAAVWLFA